MMGDVADYHPACAQVLVGLIEGLAAGAGRTAGLVAAVPMDGKAVRRICVDGSRALKSSRVD